MTMHYTDRERRILEETYPPHKAAASDPTWAQFFSQKRMNIILGAVVLIACFGMGFVAAFI